MQDGRIKGLVFIVALLVCLFVAGSFGITSTKMEPAGKIGRASCRERV